MGATEKPGGRRADEAAQSKKPALPLIFLTVVIDLIGFGIIIPVLPLYAARFGASPLEVGVLMGVFSGLQFLLAPVFGRFSDRFGRRPLLLLSMAGNVAGYALMAVAQSLPLLFAARFVSGVSGASISTAQAAVADVTAPEERARGMGLIGAAFGIGFVLGPLIGGLMALVNPAAPFWFAAGLAGVNLALLWARFPETLSRASRQAAAEAGGGSAWAEALSDRPMAALIAAYFLQTAGFSVMTAMFALFTEARLGFGMRENGFVFAFIGVVAAVIQGRLIGRLVARFGERRLAVAGALITAAGLCALPYIGSAAALVPAVLLLAAGNSLFTPAVNALVSRLAAAHHQGRALGVMQSAGSLARFLGPLFGGWLFKLHPRTAFLIGAALVALSALLVRAGSAADAEGRE